MADDDKGDRPSMIGEFLQPKAMLTPGIAGGLTTLITNALASQFGFWPNYTGLGISFLFGLLVFQAAVAIPVIQRLAYYILNSLVIFSVAIGANQTGVSLTKADRSLEQTVTASDASTTAPFFANWLDGTVPMRQQLLDAVGNVNDMQATEALKGLDVSIVGGESPKSALKAIVTSTQTSDEVKAVHLALTRAESDGMNGAAASPP